MVVLKYSNLAEIFAIRKSSVSGLWCSADTISRFSRISSCHGQTDGQTDTRRQHTALAWRLAIKNGKAEISREQFLRSIFAANVTTMSLTCHEKIGRVERADEDATRML